MPDRLQRAEGGRLIRPVLLALALAACAPVPDHVVGAWDRIFSNGVPIPPGTLDRLTFTVQGRAMKYRDGLVARGTWSGGDLGQYTLAFPGDVTTWSAVKGNCPDAPAPPPCLILRNASATDWYRGDYALLTAVEGRIARIELPISDGGSANDDGPIGLGVRARE